MAKMKPDQVALCMEVQLWDQKKWHEVTNLRWLCTPALGARH